MGLKIVKKFGDPREVVFGRRDVRIEGTDGAVVFGQRGVRAPVGWSDRAVQIVASKYFRGRGVDRENDVEALVGRVVGTIVDWGVRDDYFLDEASAEAFRSDLTYLLLTQAAAFNSPVWFNLGVEDRPQVSACFINSVEDEMESILDLAKREGMLFKFGSGAGSNLSKIRGSKEGLAGGGEASGPISFMKGFDAFAGAIKSGGKTRRAAKMVILDVDHPDVEEFVACKAREEEKAKMLLGLGVDGGLDGEAYATVAFQNANHSVRVTDEFMKAATSDVYSDDAWRLINRTDGGSTEVSARELLRKIAEAAWACGDPGIQFHTTVNDWNTCPHVDEIRGSNPCAEYMFLDDSACNLASLNVRSFQDPDGTLDLGRLSAAVATVFLAQEILVDRAGYPSPEIEANSKRFRPIGIGFANLGAAIMAAGLAYDSDEGRTFAAEVAATIQGQAALTSAYIAIERGFFEGYDGEHYVRVMSKHRDAAMKLEVEGPSANLAAAIAHGEETGFRNAQLSVVAPTGTIAFMMDCDTTGIEPDVSLVKRKALVGGGSMTYVNESVEEALVALGYNQAERIAIVSIISEGGAPSESPHLRPEHYPVFDCAFPDAAGRSISAEGHLRMMAAVQPFVSGAISKTVNLPADATVADVKAVYEMAWRLKLKAVAVYRDGCKGVQPLESGPKEAEPKEDPAYTAALDGSGTWVEPATVGPRERLPQTRKAVTHKFDVGGYEGYISVGLYDDERVGEIFVRMAKEGSTISGLMDAFATAVSVGLQYGVPLGVLVEKFAQTRFEPSGFTEDMGYASSVLDYLFRWMDETFPGGTFGGRIDARRARPTAEAPAVDSSSPPCPKCGAIMVPTGACHACPACGHSGGCG